MITRNLLHMTAFLDANVAWTVMVALSVALTFPSLFAPVDSLGLQVLAGKFAVWFRVAALPYASAASWFATSYFTLAVQDVVNADGTKGGEPVWVLSVLFASFGVVMIIWALLHGLSWDWPDEELAEGRRRGDEP